MEIVKAEDYGLTKKQGLDISSKFQILEEEKKVLLYEYNNIIKKELTPELSIEAKSLDSRLQKHLKAKKDIHTANKSFFLNGGRFVDSIYNIEKVEIDLMRESTKKIKNYAQELEKERLTKLQLERVDLVSGYVEDAENMDLSIMDDDFFEVFLKMKKDAYTEKVRIEAKIESERLEAIRIEKEEQERIREENAKLKAEAVERDRIAKIEQEKRDKIEAERKAKEDAERLKIEEKAKKEREALEDKLKAEKEAKYKLEEENRIAKEKIASELFNKQQQEKRNKEEEEARIQSELNKGDAEIKKDLITDLEALKTKYTFKSAKNKKVYTETGELLTKVINHICN